MRSNAYKIDQNKNLEEVDSSNEYKFKFEYLQFVAPEYEIKRGIIIIN